jgi:hypothetical protein
LSYCLGCLWGFAGVLVYMRKELVLVLPAVILTLMILAVAVMKMLRMNR